MGGEAARRAEGAEQGHRRRLPVAERRRQLLLAALHLFSRHSPEQVSIDDIAAAAGASRPLVYRYFPGGKQQIYEAALRSAADRLLDCFAEPPQGTPIQRLSNALDRYLAFAAEHDAGFAALVRGGAVTETSRTTAIIDEVRRGAAERIFLHLGVARPGLRLRMSVRAWIAAAEAVSLIWLDEGRQPPAEELRDWLVEQFLAVLGASAATDPQSAQVVQALLVAQAQPAGPPSGPQTTRPEPSTGAAAAGGPRRAAPRRSG